MPGRDKHEVSREVGIRKKPRSPITAASKMHPTGQQDPRGGGSCADTLTGSAVTLGLRGPLEEEARLAFHSDRRVLTGDIGQEGEINIYTFRQETGSSNSGGQTECVCVC